MSFSIACHNRVDAEKGKPLRDWSSVHFMCDDCDRDTRRRKRPRPSKAQKNTAQRMTADGRLANTPGPQPAQRTTAKGGHKVPVPLPNAPNAGFQPGYPSTSQWVQPPSGYNPHIPMTPAPQYNPHQQAQQQPSPYQYQSPTVASHPRNMVQLPSSSPYPQTPAGPYPNQFHRTPGGLPPPNPPYAQQTPYAGPSSSMQPQYHPVAGYNGNIPSLPPLPTASAGVPPPSPMGGYTAPPPHPVQVLGVGGGGYYGSPQAPPLQPYGQNGSVMTNSPYSRQSMNGLPASPVVDYPQQQQLRPGQSWAPVSPHQQYSPSGSYVNGSGAMNPALHNEQFRHTPPSAGAITSPVPGSSYTQYPPYSTPPGPYAHSQHYPPPPMSRPLSTPGHNSSPHIPELTSHHSSHSPGPSRLPSTPLSASGERIATPPMGTNGPLPRGQVYIPPSAGGMLDPSTGIPRSDLGGDGVQRATWQQDPKTGMLVHVHVPPDQPGNPNAASSSYTSTPEPPTARAPRKAPAPRKSGGSALVEPHGPGQHFSGSFRALPPGFSGAGAIGSSNGSGPVAGGRGDGSKQQIYQPPVTKPRGSTSSAVAPPFDGTNPLDTLSALAEAAQTQPHLVPASSSNLG